MLHHVPNAKTSTQSPVVVENIIETPVPLNYLESINRYLGKERTELFIEESGLYTVKSNNILTTIDFKVRYLLERTRMGNGPS